eukprot:1161635-Pelagomonas_calceolata.AAC.8
MSAVGSKEFAAPPCTFFCLCWHSLFHAAAVRLTVPNGSITTKLPRITKSCYTALNGHEELHLLPVHASGRQARGA